MDLVAEVVASGSAPSRAVAVVGECLDRAHDPAAAALLGLADRLLGSGSRPAGPRLLVVDALDAALALSVATGAGPVALIRAGAEEHRRRAQAEQVRAARRLGVLVLLPTGLCLLPAFVLLTVVPLVIDLVLG
jgi:tight adherence protein B